MVPRINLAPPLILVVRPRFIWGWPIRSMGLALWRVGPTPHLKGFLSPLWHAEHFPTRQFYIFILQWVPQTSKSGQLVLSMYFCTLWLTVALVYSWPHWFNTLFPYPENLPGDAFLASCPCGHPCGVHLQPPSLDYPPSLNTCIFECETVQETLTTSSPVLTEAAEAALPFSIACRMENPLVWQSQVSTNNLSSSLNEASFLGSQVILCLCTLKEVGQ